MVSADPAQILRRLGVELDPSEPAVEDVPHNRWLTSGIWKVAREAEPVVVKILRRSSDEPVTAWDAHWTAGSDDPQHWNYWAREGLAYLSGLVTAYEGGGIVGPALLAADQRQDEIVLVLEFVEGRPAENWGIAEYGTAAAALGRAQGEILAERPVPSIPWLSQRFLRNYSAEKPVDWSLLEDDQAWAQPLVRDNFPSGLREAAGWLHASRDRLYGIEESLPRALCHLDFWTKNLIMLEGGGFALLDWAFVGDGAIGEDIGNLVPDATFDHFVPAEALPELQACVLAGYTGALMASGWAGDPRLVELGMCAAAVKYDWLTPAMLAAASAPRQLRYGGNEEVDADYRFRERGIALFHNAQVAHSALSIASQLGF
jgi:hypothetical protein